MPLRYVRPRGHRARGRQCAGAASRRKQPRPAQFGGPFACPLRDKTVGLLGCFVAWFFFRAQDCRLESCQGLVHSENRAPARRMRCESQREMLETARPSGKGDGLEIRWPCGSAQRSLRPQSTRGGTRTRDFHLGREVPCPSGHACSCGSPGGRPPRESLGLQGTPLAGLEPAIFGLEVCRLAKGASCIADSKEE